MSSWVYITARHRLYNLARFHRIVLEDYPGGRCQIIGYLDDSDQQHSGPVVIARLRSREAAELALIEISKSIGAQQLARSE